MRKIKPYNDEGFMFLKKLKTGTSKENGRMLVLCTNCGRVFEVTSNSYYRNRIRCICENYNKRLYSIYTNMKIRCYNENGTGYKNYGGRGIKICNEWYDDYKNFEKWSMENGYSDDLTIERINVDGDYCPENCMWATVLQQVRNRRVTVKVYDIPVSKWCEDNNVNYKSFMGYHYSHPDYSLERVAYHFKKEGTYE